MTRENTADTLVIGGGLVGAAVAWGLARQGEKVILIDEGDVALRASRGNFGLVWVQSKGSGMHDYARWTRRSADLWPDFAASLTEEAGITPAYHKPGGLHFCLSEDEMDKLRRLNTAMHNVNGALGYGAEILDRKQLDDLVPGLGPDVVGGSYGAHDGHANPLALLRGLHAALAQRGGRYAGDARVETVTPDGTGYCVTTPKGAFRGAKLVLAAGHGNSRLAPQLDLDIPLRPEKGQILVTERAAPLLPMPTHLLRQTDEGAVMMGDSHEDTGYSTWSGTPVMSQIARKAIRCFPALAGLRLVRSWAAVRILTPDGAPIYQQSQTHPGVFSLNCHSGVTLAGAHALALAPMIAAGELPPDMAAFSSERFHDQTT